MSSDLKSSIGHTITKAVATRLAGEAKDFVGAAGQRVISLVTDKIGSTTERLTDFTASGGSGGGLLSAITGRGKGGKGAAGAKNKKLKVTNIVEEIDVGAPVRVCYDQWTRFTDFPNFMKKVESVEQESDEKLRWKAQVFWSHRTWESTIMEQVPDQRIVWQSKGDKGSVDGAVTFHELAPELTRIVLVLEYHPQGLFERTGNIWRAQGRRARLELKHFARHVMRDAVLHPQEIQGWRGEIHDGQVVQGPQETAEGGEEETAERQGPPPQDLGEERERQRREGRPARRYPGGQEERPVRRRRREESSVGPSRSNRD